jgi:2-polyprenyl-3-methyl-5-hydroxy-6-metoxy-1,4-benzoquinol methylase
MVQTQHLQVEHYVEREESIIELCRGKRVLHLGCVGWTDLPSTDKVQLAGASFHQSLSEVCDCTGVDIDGATIEELQRAGLFHNVVTGDAESLTGAAEYDVVVAGDIIEHLSNPGSMLDGALKVAKSGGMLIVSTPNAFGLPAFARLLAGRFREGAQHVLNFNYLTLQQLLHRHGWKPLCIHGCYQKAARQRKAFGLTSVPLRILPRFAGTLLVAAEKRTDNMHW